MVLPLLLQEQESPEDRSTPSTRSFVVKILSQCSRRAPTPVRYIPRDSFRVSGRTDDSD